MVLLMVSEHRHTDRQPGRYTDRLTDRHIHTEKYRHTDRHIHTHISLMLKKPGLVQAASVCFGSGYKCQPRPCFQATHYDIAL